MKAVLLVALLVAGADAGALTLIAQICQIPSKYTVLSSNACAGSQPGYLITGYCQNPFHPFPRDIQIAPTVSALLTPATGTAWTTTVAGLSNGAGCVVPIDMFAWNAVSFGGVLISADANQCLNAAAPAPAVVAVATPGSLTPWKGVSIVCDTANNYYVSAGVEGSMFCYGGGTGTGLATNMNAAAVNAGIWSATLGLLTSATRTATWDTSVLTCNLGCTFAAPVCTANTYHANIIIWGTGLVTNTCIVRPGTSVTLYCRNDPFTAYTA